MKKTLILIGTLIIGFALGVTFCYVLNTNDRIAPASHLSTSGFIFSGSLISKKGANLAPASTILRAKAKVAILSYQSMNQTLGASGIKNENGDFLEGFFIDATSLKSILNNAAVSYSGINFYIGKKPGHETTNDKVLTLFFGGARSNPKGHMGGTGDSTEYLTDDPIYEYIDPCPPHCSDLKN